MPGTKKRLRLTIGTDPDVTDALDDAPEDTIRDRLEDVEDDTKIGLEYFFLKQAERISPGRLILKFLLV